MGGDGGSLALLVIHYASPLNGRAGKCVWEYIGKNIKRKAAEAIRKRWTSGGWGDGRERDKVTYCFKVKENQDRHRDTYCFKIK